MESVKKCKSDILMWESKFRHTRTTYDLMKIRAMDCVRREHSEIWRGSFPFSRASGCTVSHDSWAEVQPDIICCWSEDTSPCLPPFYEWPSGIRLLRPNKNINQSGTQRVLTLLFAFQRPAIYSAVWKLLSEVRFLSMRNIRLPVESGELFLKLIYCE